MSATVCDDRVADLDRQLRQLDLVEAAQVGGVLDGGQDRHGYELLGLTEAGPPVRSG